MATEPQPGDPPQRTVFDDPVAMARLGRLFAKGLARKMARRTQGTNRTGEAGGPR